MSFLGEISNFSKGNLRPTETVVSKGIVADSPRGYGHANAQEILEHQERPEDLEKKVAKLADALRKAKHAVAYTGAGISTSADLPDYRGPKGVWTLADKGMRPTGGATIETASPTYTHMTFTMLAEQGLLKHIVSTNVDGLHLRSGFPVAQLSELHGNAYKEYCSKCGAFYMRDFDVAVGRADHKTGRHCEKSNCKGELLDSIINFGENLPKEELKTALGHARKSDLALVCGTSMRVKPACDLPELCLQNQGLFVLINRQETPFDSLASLIIRADMDDVMLLLNKQLNLDGKVARKSPQGHKVRVPVLKQDEKYKAYLTEKQKLSAPPRMPAQPNVAASTAKSSPSPSPAQASEQAPPHVVQSFFKTNRNTITGTGLKQDVDAAGLVYISKCVDCDLTLTNKATKVVIVNCQSTVVRVQGGVITGYCEVIRCKDLTVHLACTVPTLSVDLSQNTEVFFQSPRYMKDVVSASNNKLTVSVTAPSASPSPAPSPSSSAPTTSTITHVAPVDRDTVGEEAWASNQYITRFREESRDFVTEEAVRNGGYTTSASDQVEFDKRAERNREVLDKLALQDAKLNH